MFNFTVKLFPEGSLGGKKSRAVEKLHFTKCALDIIHNIIIIIHLYNMPERVISFMGFP